MRYQVEISSTRIDFTDPHKWAIHTVYPADKTRVYLEDPSELKTHTCYRWGHTWGLPTLFTLEHCGMSTVYRTLTTLNPDE